MLPRRLVAGQALTWVGAPAEGGAVQPDDRGVFIDYEGDEGSYVVDFNGAMFCCAASDVRVDPRDAVRVGRRHNAP